MLEGEKDGKIRSKLAFLREEKVVFGKSSSTSASFTECGLQFRKSRVDWLEGEEEVQTFRQENFRGGGSGGWWNVRRERKAGEETFFHRVENLAADTEGRGGFISARNIRIVEETLPSEMIQKALLFGREQPFVFKRLFLVLSKD